jgi:uncharacterized protein YhbP (UPF0306 family)
MKILSTTDIDGNKIKIQFDDSVAQFIKGHAIVTWDDFSQKTYKINNIVYTFDDEELN